MLTVQGSGGDVVQRGSATRPERRRSDGVGDGSRQGASGLLGSAGRCGVCLRGWKVSQGGPKVTGGD